MIITSNQNSQCNYRKSHVCGKIGGYTASVGTLMYLASGESQQFISRGHKLTKELLGNTNFYKKAQWSKLVSGAGVVGGAVALSYVLGRLVFGLFDRQINKKRAEETNS